MNLSLSIDGQSSDCLFTFLELVIVLVIFIFCLLGGQYLIHVYLSGGGARLTALALLCHRSCSFLLLHFTLCEEEWSNWAQDAALLLGFRRLAESIGQGAQGLTISLKFLGLGGRWASGRRGRLFGWRVRADARLRGRRLNSSFIKFLGWEFGISEILIDTHVSICIICGPAALGHHISLVNVESRVRHLQRNWLLNFCRFGCVWWLHWNFRFCFGIWLCRDIRLRCSDRHLSRRTDLLQLAPQSFDLRLVHLYLLEQVSLNELRLLLLLTKFQNEATLVAVVHVVVRHLDAVLQVDDAKMHLLFLRL